MLPRTQQLAKMATGKTKATTVSLYELLRVAPAATDKEIRKAYLVLSRAVHPDRNPSKHAEEDFIALKKAYDILSDTAKRERYDRTGQVDDESQSFADAYERYRGVPISDEDIVSYMESYRNSEAEKQDLVDYFEAHRGDVSRILGSVVGSNDKDIPRFVKFLKAALRSGQVFFSRAQPKPSPQPSPQPSPSPILTSAPSPIPRPRASPSPSPSPAHAHAHATCHTRDRWIDR